MLPLSNKSRLPHRLARRDGDAGLAASLTKQTITLTLANAYTRGLGFLLRLALARIMGAEALGMMELTSSVSMLALTPVTAGTPSP